jgi:hypothetical protein
MNASFDIEGEHYVVAPSDAVALFDELLRQGGRLTNGLGDDVAAAIVIEHHLVECRDEPIKLTPQEGQAVLAAMFAAPERLCGPELDAIRDALRQRRRLELGLGAG